MDALKKLEEYANDVGLEPEEKPSDEEVEAAGRDRNPHFLWARVWRRSNPHAEVWAHIPAEGAPDVPLARAKALRVGDIGIRVLTDGATMAANDTAVPPQPLTSDATVTNERQLPLFLTVEEGAAILRLPNRKALYTKIERGQVEGVVRQGIRILLDRDAFLRGIKRGSK